MRHQLPRALVRVVAAAALALVVVACDGADPNTGGPAVTTPPQLTTSPVTPAPVPAKGVHARVEAPVGRLATWHSHPMTVVLTNNREGPWTGRLSLRIVHDSWNWELDRTTYAVPFVDVDRSGEWTAVRADQRDDHRYDFDLGRFRLAAGETRSVETRIAVDTIYVEHQQLTVTPYLDREPSRPTVLNTAGVSISAVTMATGCAMDQSGDQCSGDVTLTNRAATPVEDVGICGHAAHSVPSHDPSVGTGTDHDHLDLSLGADQVRLDPAAEQALSLGPFASGASRTFHFTASLTSPWPHGTDVDFGAVQFNLRCGDVRSGYYTSGGASYLGGSGQVGDSDPED